MAFGAPLLTIRAQNFAPEGTGAANLGAGRRCLDNDHGRPDDADPLRRREPGGEVGARGIRAGGADAVSRQDDAGGGPRVDRRDAGGRQESRRPGAAARVAARASLGVQPKRAR